jgi:hypothetical protein
MNLSFGNSAGLLGRRALSTAKPVDLKAQLAQAKQGLRAEGHPAMRTEPQKDVFEKSTLWGNQWTRRQ